MECKYCGHTTNIYEVNEGVFAVRHVNGRIVCDFCGCEYPVSLSIGDAK